jgi:hypothetical protein
MTSFVTNTRHSYGYACVSYLKIHQIHDQTQCDFINSNWYNKAHRMSKLLFLMSIQNALSEYSERALFICLGNSLPITI